MAIGKIFGESYRFTKLLLFAIIFLSIFGSIYYVFRGGSSVGGAVQRTIDRVQGTTPVPVNLPETVSDERLKCRAYTLLADFEGAPSRLDVDKSRILWTVARLSKQGVGECEIFTRQLELVVQGWGRRQYCLGVATFCTKINVPNRQFGYIETTFSENLRNEALLLAKQAAEKPDPYWEATVLVRPDRPHTMGNQKPDEIQKIEGTMDPVALNGSSDFKFYKPRKPK